jgi:hypothetical protein
MTAQMFELVLDFGKDAVRQGRRGGRLFGAHGNVPYADEFSSRRNAVAASAVGGKSPLGAMQAYVTRSIVHAPPRTAAAASRKPISRRVDSDDCSDRPG